MFNNEHERIQFTIEKEVGGCLLSLDTVIMRTGNGPNFKLQNTENKDDYKYLCEYRGKKQNKNKQVKSSFFLRAYKICSPEFLEDKLHYPGQTFVMLKYPSRMMLKSRNKAEAVTSRQQNDSNRKSLKVPIVPDSR